MSFSLSTPLARIDPASHPTISISADAHHFAAPSLVQIAHELSTQYGQFAAVEPNHYFQFGAEPLPIVVMEYSAALVAAAPPQMFSALLYDIIKSSLRIRRTKRGEPTVFEGFERVEPDGTRELSWYLRTDSEEVALKAVESLPMSSRRLEFKATHTWEPISGDRDLPT